MKFYYECSTCGKIYRTDEIMYQCPECAKLNDGSEFAKGNLIVKLEKEEYERLGKMEAVTPEDFNIYKLEDNAFFPLGPTPLMSPKNIIAQTGFKNLKFKLDTQLISGSFKDRASILVAAQALHHNEKKIALASTGNAGAAMSAVGAALGLDIILFVPASAPINKLMQSVLYGAKVIPVKGTYDDAFALSIEYTKRYGGINRNTAFNPITIEGKKSVSIELFNQYGRKAPDVVYVPTGDGCIFAGVAKGFYDLLQAGLIDKMPHLVAAQSVQSNAISQAFRTGKMVGVNATTRADSISVSLPANGAMAVSYIKMSDGWSTEVTDQALLDAQLLLTRGAGVLAEPAAATAYAAFLQDKEKLEREFGKDAEICVLLTGTGFKDMAAFDGRVSIPPAIENSVEALKDLN